MFLAIDAGNSNITFGVFDCGKIIAEHRLETHSDNLKDECVKLLENLSEKYSLEECIISSVVKNLDYTIKEIIDKVLNIDSTVFDSNMNIGVNLNIDNLSEVGKDRIANALCAHNKYPFPAIVIDIGTATTFDILDKNGYFIGGIILPGIKMQFDSLNQKTSLLPKLDIQKIDHVIGKNTKDNILSGVIRGHACAINGLIHKCESELGTKTTIILTGGLSEFIAEYIDNFDYCDKNLTLEGLKILYDLNKN